MKNKIKDFRQEMGMTQEDLAKKAKVSRQTISALENGKYNPSLSLAFKITKILRRGHIEDVFILEDK
ncbi:MAG: helix-turn-helix transcriptional regulator [Methanobrevibacter sp.]|jgi:putative transcriptional regulator|nr:helix-turn-helix transcriptional regulator [Methanobrevibacter sp.]